MKDTQKAAFLRKEGWKKQGGDDYYAWLDPNSKYCSRYNLNYAYLLATKRKAARDIRKLKKAGFILAGRHWWYERYTGNGKDAFTREEAIQTLRSHKNANH